MPLARPLPQPRRHSPPPLRLRWRRRLRQRQQRLPYKQLSLKLTVIAAPAVVPRSSGASGKDNDDEEEGADVEDREGGAVRVLFWVKLTRRPLQRVLRRQ